MIGAELYLLRDQETFTTTIVVTRPAKSNIGGHYTTLYHLITPPSPPLLGNRLHSGKV